MSSLEMAILDAISNEDFVLNYESEYYFNNDVVEVIDSINSWSEGKE